MTGKTPRVGPGRFQWNAGGWFGAQLGSTLWMVLAGALLLVQRPVVGLTILCVAALANGVGWWLWSRRDHLAPYPAIQILLAVVGVAALAVLLIVDVSETGDMIAGYGGRSWSLYALLFMFPLMMTVFHLQERSAKR